MATNLKYATSGRPAFADDIGGPGVPGNVLTRVAGPLPGSPDDVEWAPGGGGAALAQLTNARWVDKNTTVPLGSQTGTVGAPFHTISQAITALLATGGTILVVPGDYTGEGAQALDGANPFSVINVAGLQLLPGETTGALNEVLLPSLLGSASKFVQGCSTTSLVSTGAHVWAMSCKIHGFVQAHINARVWSCLFDRDVAGAQPVVTTDLGTLVATNCRFVNAGDLASLSANTHTFTGCTFGGAGTGLIDGPAPGVIVALDTYSNFGYNTAYGANFGANANPQIISKPDTRIGSGVIPALAAGQLAYLDVNIAQAGAPPIPANTRVSMNMVADLAPAGAGVGFIPYMRMSADDTVRLTLVGALAGGLTNFVFQVG